MPESRSRSRRGFTPPPTSDKTARRSRGAASRYIAPAMCTCWIIGLLWIVTFYVAGDRIGLLSSLGNWNLLIGMGLIALGFVFATRWE